MSRVLDQAFDHPLEREEQASTPLVGGIMLRGYQCGMPWGATLAAGAQAYRIFGPGPQAESRALLAAQGLVESFRALNGHVNCVEITGLDLSTPTMKMILYFFVKGGVIGCFRMAARYAPVAFGEINAALSEKGTEAPNPPVSCSALLAQKMGASDMHAVMAAGFAGGIGLSGGACGALGAAVWIIGLKRLAEGDGIDFQDPRALETIDRFTECTDHKFECTEIVGRNFRSIDDHADYLRAGGCSNIIDVLAMQ